MKKHAIAVIGAAALGAAGATVGTYLYIDNTQSRVEVAAPAPAPAPTDTPPPALPPEPEVVPGAYNFTIKGGSALPVTLDACGPECFALVAPPSETNPDGFRQEMRLTGTQYAGQSHSENAVVCASDNQPRAAENRYSMNLDGTNGLVEVLGQPCGAEAPNVPLAFTLRPAPVPIETQAPAK